MFKNRFEILLKDLKKLIERFKHIKTFFEKSDKFRTVSSEKAKENNFFYIFFNVKMITMYKIRLIQTNTKI